MKKGFLTFGSCVCFIFQTALLTAFAQHSPVKLAVVSAEADLGNAVDFLIAVLTKKDNLILLERNEIERIYREHSLSAGNVDYV